MALGTITFARGNTPDVWGDRKVIRGTVACSAGANYTTGGETITAAALGLRTLESLYVQQPVGATRIVTWDSANGKLKCYTALSTEAASNSDQSAIVVHYMAVGY